MTKGRPPVPNEIKRKRGTARPDRTPALAEVSVLPMADGVPDPPADLGLAGRDLWARAWREAITWVSPDSDWPGLVEACSLADDLEVARQVYRAKRDSGDGRLLVNLSKRYSEALSELGFTPTARARLGVAEVKRVSQLEQLLAARATRRPRPAARTRAVGSAQDTLEA